MGGPSPLTVLWLDVKWLDCQLTKIQTQRADREPGLNRVQTVVEIQDVIGKLFTRLRRKEWANVAAVDGSDGRQWAASLATSLNTLQTGISTLAVPELDEADLAEVLGECRQVAEKSEYLRGLMSMEPVGDVAAEPAGPDEPPHPYQISVCERNLQVRFGDETGTVRRLKGADDVLRLIAKPNSPISCEALEGIKPTVAGTVARDDNRKELEVIKVRIEQIEEELQTELAEDCVALEDEREKLIKRLSQITYLGKPRFADSPSRKAVCQRIDKFIDACRKSGLPLFAAHLDDSIDRGRSCNYRVAPAPEWRIYSK